MAPLRSHIFHLFHTLRTKRKVSYWYGARSKREMFYTEEFEAIEKEFPNFKYHVSISASKQTDESVRCTLDPFDRGRAGARRRPQRPVISAQ